MIGAKRIWIALLLLALAAAAGCERALPPDPVPNLARALEIRRSFGTSVAPGEGQSSAEPGQQPTGWATLRGVFRLAGAAPTRPALNVNKDEAVCAPGGTQILSESLVVGSDGGIKDVVIFLDARISEDEPWTHPSAKPGKSDEMIFDQKQCIFLSHVLAMQTTQTLKILNSDPMGHNTNMSPVINTAFNQTIPSGGQVPYQPTGEERQPFPVTCSIHPWMQAWILTRNNSYFAVTKPDGSFEIPNLPAGVDLEFRVWQEKSKFIQRATVNGQAQNWPKGRLTRKLDGTDESQNQLEIRLDVALFQ